MGKKNRKKAVTSITGTMANMVLLPVMAAGVIVSSAVVRTIGETLTFVIEAANGLRVRIEGSKEGFISNNNQ